MALTRRSTVALGTGLAAGLGRLASAAAPVPITILDVGGALQLMQPAIGACCPV